MKVLYTAHMCGDHTGVVQRVVDIPHTVLVGQPVDSVIEYIAAESGISVDSLLIPSPPEKPDSFVVNEYGVFIAASDCHESWVILN